MANVHHGYMCSQRFSVNVASDEAVLVGEGEEEHANARYLSKFEVLSCELQIQLLQFPCLR